MLNDDLVDDDLSSAGIITGNYPRCACVLLLDTSTSMQDDPIDSLNEGLKIFRDEILKNQLAKKRVEVAIVEFNSTANVIQDFVQAQDFDPPTLVADGATAMGEGIEKAIELLTDRKKIYKASGLHVYCPWIFMITDGAPTDSIETAIKKIEDGERKKAFMFFSVGVQGADMSILKSINPVRVPLKLDGLMFGEMFKWVSMSLSKVSQSNPNEQVPLPPVGWGVAG